MLAKICHGGSENACVTGIAFMVLMLISLFFNERDVFHTDEGASEGYGITGTGPIGWT